MNLKSFLTGYALGLAGKAWPKSVKEPVAYPYNGENAGVDSGNAYTASQDPVFTIIGMIVGIRIAGQRGTSITDNSAIIGKAVIGRMIIGKG